MAAQIEALVMKLLSRELRLIFRLQVMATIEVDGTVVEDLVVSGEVLADYFGRSHGWGFNNARPIRSRFRKR